MQKINNIVKKYTFFSFFFGKVLASTSLKLIIFALSKFYKQTLLALSPLIPTNQHNFVIKITILNPKHCFTLIFYKFIVSHYGTQSAERLNFISTKHCVVTKIFIAPTAIDAPQCTALMANFTTDYKPAALPVTKYEWPRQNVGRQKSFIYFVL